MEPAMPCNYSEDRTRKSRVTRRSLQTVLEQCQQTLDQLQNADLQAVGDGERGRLQGAEGLGSLEDPDSSRTSVLLDDSDESDEICDLVKSRLESPAFLEKLGSMHMSKSQNISDENTSWDMVTTTDLWEDMHMEGDSKTGQDGYILIGKEDIADGIACFMASYLLSLEQTKDLSPNQLQEALGNTFSVKKKKGKLRKAWEGSKVVYNVASWGATAIGIYQNPALLKVASGAFWTSCNVISKLF